MHRRDDARQTNALLTASSEPVCQAVIHFVFPNVGQRRAVTEDGSGTPVRDG